MLLCMTAFSAHEYQLKNLCNGIQKKKSPTAIHASQPSLIGD